MTVLVAGLLCAAVFTVLSVVAFTLSDGGLAGVPLAGGALIAAAVGGRAGRLLRDWPPGRLALFRDRLLVIHGRHEMRALWSNMEAVTLAAPNSWPDVRLTDRLTIRLKNERPLSFRPAVFGLQPAACRDLILKLRDDPTLRDRLPEFDSLRDLAVSPVVAGELIEPGL